MSTFITFAVIGLGLGAAYALLAQGLVLVQVGSGVVNFAHGALAMISAFTFWELSSAQHWSFWPSFVAAVALATLLGAAIYRLVMHPLREFSALTRVMATLAVLLLLESVGFLIWGDIPRYEPPFLPTSLIHFGNGIFLGVDKAIALGIACAITLGLWAGFRYTPLGLAIRATAENERGAETLGWSPQTLATLTWAAGGMLAGVAGVLLAPLASLQTVDISLLVIPAMAAALAGGFVSFPLTLVGAIVIGVGQSLLANYFTNIVGLETALPFMLIITLLVIRGKSLPVRGATSTARLPALGTGNVRKKWLLLAVGGWLLIIAFAGLPVSLLGALTTSVAWGIILLSVVVLMGYTGQLDLAPLAWGGLAVLLTGHLVAWGVSFAPAVLIGVAAAIPVGVIFALPAVRARGLNLAVVTLGLGLTVDEIMFQNTTLVPGNALFPGATATVFALGNRTLFGWNVSSVHHPGRYLGLCIVAFAVLGLGVAAVRRGRAGRRLIAVRTNERAAAALGISVIATKIYAFGLAAAIAAMGGILLAFQFDYVNLYATFNPIGSMTAAIDAVIGGVGFVLGPIFGSQLATGGFGTWVFNEILPGANPEWIAVIGAAGTLIVLLQSPSGLALFNTTLMRMHAGQLRALYSWGMRAIGRAGGPSEQAPARQYMRSMLREARHGVAAEVGIDNEFPPTRPDEVHFRSAVLTVDGLSVRYGGVVAVSDASLTVRPGEIVGLIGPNGAGKTSVIDAITGFARANGGEIKLDGKRIDRWPVHKRARAGVCRSFQSLELFESITVRENLQIADDAREGREARVRRPRRGVRSSFSPLARVVVSELGLQSELRKTASDLSYGARRLTAIARTMIGNPAVLLLDEPVAGLSDHESQQLAHALRRLAHEWQLAILIVEHDMTFVMNLCHALVVLDFGKVIATGAPGVVRQDPAVIAAYLGGADLESGESTYTHAASVE